MLLKLLTQPEWTSQGRGSQCLAHAAQSIATPLNVCLHMFLA